MNPELATVLIMTVSIATAALGDVWLAKRFGQKFTMTGAIRRFTLNNIWLQIAITLAFGLLLGHFFLVPDCAELTQEGETQPPAAVAPK